MTSVAATVITQSERNSSDESANIIPTIGRAGRAGRAGENENIPFLNFDLIALYSSLSKCYFSFCIICKFLLSLPNVINLSDLSFTAASSSSHPPQNLSSLLCSSVYSLEIF